MGQKEENAESAKEIIQKDRLNRRAQPIEITKENQTPHTDGVVGEEGKDLKGKEPGTQYVLVELRKGGNKEKEKT